MSEKLIALEKDLTDTEYEIIRLQRYKAEVERDIIKECFEQGHHNLVKIDRAMLGRFIRARTQ